MSGNLCTRAQSPVIDNNDWPTNSETHSSHPNNDFIPKRSRFSYTLPGLEMTLTEEIEKLENLQRQSLHAYFRNFEQLSMQCQWNDHQKFLILQSLIDQNLKSIISGQVTYSAAINALIKSKYPDVDANKYLFKL